jgi:hypothetical protein
LTGTWATPKISLAIAKGYKIIKIYEVYHFEETSTELFRGYVDCFLKIKQESSGWPAWCGTPAQKQQYIDSYKEKEGVELDQTKISVNPGLPSLAKLCLNSFWGKFGQRDIMRQSQMIYKP